MAFRSIQASLGSTPAQFYVAQDGDVEIVLGMASGSSGHIGGPTLTTGNGFYLQATHGQVRIKVRSGDELWGVAGSGAQLTVLIRSI